MNAEYLHQHTEIIIIIVSKRVSRAICLSTCISERDTYVQ